MVDIPQRQKRNLKKYALVTVLAISRRGSLRLSPSLASILPVCFMRRNYKGGPFPRVGAELVPPFPTGYSMFAVGIGTLLFGYWSMMKWNRERR